MKNLTNIIIILLLLAVGLLTFMSGRLIYPLGSQGKKIIEKTVDEFLEDKVFDLMWKKTIHWTTFFESLDGYATTGTVNISENDVVLTTGASTDDSASIYKAPSWQGLITFNQKSYWRTTATLNNVDDVTEYLVVGSLASGSYYGFKIVDDSLMGVSFDGRTEKTTTLAAVRAAHTYNIEARYTPSDKIVFLVDAVESGVITENLPLPNDVPNLTLFTFKIITGSDTAKTLQASFFEYLQSRNVLQ